MVRHRAASGSSERSASDAWLRTCRRDDRMGSSRVQQTPTDEGPVPSPARRVRVGWVVAASLVTGFIVALLLPFAPFIPAEESAITGAVLCGFALGWAML